MSAWDEFIAFVRGTRPRPPAAPAQPLGALLLVLAALLHMPLVYLLVLEGTVVPAVVLGVGLFSMGLAWAGGVSLEGRRLGTIRFLCAVGIAEGALAFIPQISAPLGAARWSFVAIGMLAAASLAIARKSVPGRAQASS